jgi:F0F1-type ATP synthase assembly protein I
MQIFSEVSSWIAVPIILALIAGKALDKHYGTKPTMLLVSAGIGFLVTAFGIFRTVRNYMKKIKGQ